MQPPARPPPRPPRPTPGARRRSPRARRNLPPSEQWPELLLDRPEFQYPEYLNAAVELTDRIVEKGLGDRIALIGNGRQRTYKELADWSNRLAHALVEDYGVRPGNRVLIRSGNNPALVAAWLAATKAGAVCQRNEDCLYLNVVRPANAKVKVHTIAFVDPGEDYEKALRQIADDSGGTFRFVAAEDLP